MATNYGLLYPEAMEKYQRLAQAAPVRGEARGVSPMAWWLQDQSDDIIRPADFIPGPQQAMAVKDFNEARMMTEDAEGLMGKGLGYGLQGMSLMGAIPFMGGVTKPLSAAAKKKLRDQARKAARMKKSLVSASEDPNLSQSERDLLADFGSKFEKEKALAAAVKRAESAPGAGGGRGLMSGKSEAVAPDVYRQLEKDQGQEEVLRQARAGGHLKRRADGTYVGGPRTVTSPQGLGTMRRHLDKDFDESVNAVAVSDPERLGTWYDRAKGGQAMSNTPEQLARSLDAHGVYSAGVSPESELGFALGDLSGRILNTGKKAYRGAGKDKMAKSHAAGPFGPPVDLEFKVGEYRDRNNPMLANEGLFGVNDFRRAQGMNFTDPSGAPWRAGVQKTMHPFMDAETALQVDRANQIGVGGKTDWQGPHIQEEPWVYGKAQDYFLRGSEGTGQYNPANHPGGALGAVKQAIQDANKTTADYMPKHAFSATHEAVPGASSGHRPDLLQGGGERYTDQTRWDVPMATTTGPGGTVGAGNRDALYNAVGFRQLPSERGTGAYMNSEGLMENNPLTISRPLVDFEIGSHKIDPETTKALDAVENMRAVIDAQEAYAGNLPKTGRSIKGRADTLMEGPQPTPEQMEGLLQLTNEIRPTKKVKGGQHGPPQVGQFDAIPTGRGLMFTDLGELGDSRAAKKIGQAAQDIYPGTPTQMARESIYGPGLGKRQGDEIVPTTPGSGEATTQALEKFVGIDQGVADRIANDPQVRDVLERKMSADAGMMGTRPDIQKTRAFFMQKEWPKIVQYAREKGVPIGVAASAMGYSMAGLAADGEQPAGM